MNDAPCVTVRHYECCSNDASASSASLRHDVFLRHSKGKADVAHPLKGCATSVSRLSQSFCKKCNSKSMFRDDEEGFPHCVRCGWTDNKRKKHVSPGALLESLRPSVIALHYIGPDLKMRKIRMKVKIGSKNKGEGGLGKIKYTGICPHCGSEMFYSAANLSTGPIIKTKNGIQTHSVQCADKHRVLMITNEKKGFIGWR